MPGAARGGRRRLPVRPLVMALTMTAGLAWALPVPGQSIGYTASIYGARGTCPASTATSAYLFNSVDVTTGPVRVTSAVPFVHQRTLSTDAAVDPLTGGTLDVETRATGFGDPLIRVDLRVLGDRRRALQAGVAVAARGRCVWRGSRTGSTAAHRLAAGPADGDD
jgi:hypothetical protein